MSLSTESTDELTDLLGLEKPSGKRKWIKLLIAGIAIAAIALILLTILSARRQPAIQYTTEPVKIGSITETVGATGALQPRDQVDVGTEISGTVKEVLVDYNDRVTTGQVMARLDPIKLNTWVLQSRAALDAAEAGLRQAKATVTETRISLERLEKSHKLSNGRIPSQMDLDTARARYDQARAAQSAAEAQIVQAKATLEGNQSDLTKAVIRSPIDGIILTRSVEPGQTMAASLQTPVLFTIAKDLSVMELIVDVDEADVSRVHEGQTARFTVDAHPGRQFPATLTQVRFAPKTTSNVVTYETLLSVQNTELLLRPGMTATAEITVHQVQDAVLVPNAALRYAPQEESVSSPQPQRSLASRLLPRPPRGFRGRPDSGGNEKEKQNQVWILRENRPVPVPVVPGASNGVVTEIRKSDLKTGDLVIVDEATVGK